MTVPDEHSSFEYIFSYLESMAESKTYTSTAFIKTLSTLSTPMAGSTPSLTQTGRSTLSSFMPAISLTSWTISTPKSAPSPSSKASAKPVKTISYLSPLVNSTPIPTASTSNTTVQSKPPPKLLSLSRFFNLSQKQDSTSRLKPISLP